jgi:hypothetical protein
MDVATLARRIVVRHKEDGYLRFELPADLTGPAARMHIETGLRRRAGVFRVSFEPQRRLSIRFEPLQCKLHDVARDLRNLLDDLPAEPAAGEAQAAASLAPAADPFAEIRQTFERGARQVSARINRVLDQLRKPGAPPGSLQARLQPALQNALTEQATVNFLNDVLVFYLIKVHWDLITKRWMKDPVGHADAWLATFYLVFLLVRYRKSIAK